MSKVALIAKLPSAPGRRDDLAAALAPLLTAVEAERGTIQYILHDDAGDADVLWIYELYTDEDALDAHGSSEAMRAVGGQLGALLGGAPELTRLVPRGGKGL